MTAPCLREVNGALQLALKAQPRAARDEIAGLMGGELKVRITAPPADNAANEAVLRYLAECLRLPRGGVSLVRGHTSRHKVVQIRGLRAAEAAARLGLVA